MERRDSAGVVRFFTERIVAGDLQLDGDVAQHARARRLEAGQLVQLVDGRGGLARGNIRSVGRNEVVVHVDELRDVPRPLELDVLVPVADRDRMLLAAEKCVELQVTGWRPVYFARSRSVNPRGEGERFTEKLRARMASALEQSGNAWMPAIHEPMSLEEALGAFPDNRQRLVLHQSGVPLLPLARVAPTALAVGPEGGIEDLELRSFERSGWVSSTLGSTILRFETALIAATAVVRAAQLPRSG